MRGQRRKPDRSKSGVHAKKSTTGLSNRFSFNAGEAVARVAKCVDRAGRRKAQWAEEKATRNTKVDRSQPRANIARAADANRSVASTKSPSTAAVVTSLYTFKRPRYYHPRPYGSHGISDQLPDTVQLFLKHLQDFYKELLGSLPKI